MFQIFEGANTLDTRGKYGTHIRSVYFRIKNVPATPTIPASSCAQITVPLENDWTSNDQTSWIFVWIKTWRTDAVLFYLMYRKYELIHLKEILQTKNGTRWNKPDKNQFLLACRILMDSVKTWPLFYFCFALLSRLFILVLSASLNAFWIAKFIYFHQFYFYVIYSDCWGHFCIFFQAWMLIYSLMKGIIDLCFITQNIFCQKSWIIYHWDVFFVFRWILFILLALQSFAS